MKVTGYIRDFFALRNVNNARKERIISASPKPIRHDPIKALSKLLHPELNVLIIKSIIDITDEVKIIRFIAKENSDFKIPIFQAGQYMSIYVNLNENIVTRPYFISSPPTKLITGTENEDYFEPYIEVIISKKEDGLVTSYIWNNWKVGLEVEATLPHGRFYYEPLRDEENLICIAEDVGIAAFYSMMCDVIEKKLSLKLTVLYKKKNFKTLALIEDINSLIQEAPDRLSIKVISEDENYSSVLRNFSIDIINMSTFFVCGSQEMYGEILDTLTNLNVPLRRIRKQISGETIEIYEDIKFPEEAKYKSFNIKIMWGNKETIIEGHSNETILTSLEKANIEKISNCKNGECGFCRSRIISGEVFANTTLDIARSIDKKYGYFHPCISYPISDLTIDILN